MDSLPPLPHAGPSSSSSRTDDEPDSPSNARFSRLLSTVLGSPFLTTADPFPLPPTMPHFHLDLPMRPSSPAPTADFSLLEPDPEYAQAYAGHYPHHGRSVSSPLLNLSSKPRASPQGSKSLHSLASYPAAPAPSPAQWLAGSGAYPQQHAQNPLKALLPRLWEVLSSPGRSVLGGLGLLPSPVTYSPIEHYYYYYPPSPTSSSSSSDSNTSTPCPSPRPRRARTESWASTASAESWNTVSGDLPPPWGTLPYHTHTNYKGKARASTYTLPGFADFPPLDGEEGELIEDEACCVGGYDGYGYTGYGVGYGYGYGWPMEGVDARAVTGIDILALLPPELALHILIMLCPPPLSPSSPSATTPSSDAADPIQALHTLLVCHAVSRTWRKLAHDNAVWQALFLGRWEVGNLGAYTRKRELERPRAKLLAPRISMMSKMSTGTRASVVSSILPPARAPLTLPWHALYRDRLELERRWARTARISPDEKHYPRTVSVSSLAVRDGEVEFTTGFDEDAVAGREEGVWEPQVRRISGHTDSVYCLEFDSTRIITGSRDRSIKVWSLRTGRLLGTFAGEHRGSVLCLKFERDWEVEGAELADGENGEGEVAEEGIFGAKGERKGFMVSGSSDCSVCVWDLALGRAVGGDGNGEGDREVNAEVRSVLRGHTGGVLDLRIDKKWIVSCSKDATILVFSRTTLAHHRTLRGHEGPVNSVGLQNGHVVSASGDGKMILWDVESGERVRTFEGHDRGLACIDFRDNLIVSGSNDCKIKLWNALTGECLRTLVGHEGLVRGLSFDPKSGRLVSASYDKSVKVWDLWSGKLVRDFKRTHTSHIFDVKFDVSRIVSTSHDQKIVVLDFGTGLDTSLFV